jgi:mannobiose 2-epimerase
LDQARLRAFRQEVEQELLGRIVPFWMEHTVDAERGGFIGRLRPDLGVEPGAPKGLILNARLFWTFSAVYSRTRAAAHLAMAERARDYLETRFWDQQHGGAYWMLDADGRPLDQKKKIYGQAFLLYAYSEHARATGDARSLEWAHRLFELIEAKSHDPAHGGYLESFERDWGLASDLRLGDTDLNTKKSMNTHLHVLEAYSALVALGDHPMARERLGELVDLFRAQILDPRSLHLRLFFDEDWRSRSDHVSFGHDIEASWLIFEAAQRVGRADQTLRELVVGMARAVLAEGVDPDHGLVHEAGPLGIVDGDKHWWPQAEAAVGFLNAFELSHDERLLEASLRSWEFIKTHLLDRVHGEWFYGVHRDGRPDLEREKVSEWKCPYHNGRMCLELMDRLARLI